MLSLQKESRGKRHTNLLYQFKFYIDDFKLNFLFKLGFCLGFANLDIQTNKLLAVHTLKSTLYIVQQLKRAEKKGGDHVKKYFVTKKQAGS